jgi:hypothetical protein
MAVLTTCSLHGPVEVKSEATQGGGVWPDLFGKQGHDDVVVRSARGDRPALGSTSCSTSGPTGA